MFLVASPLLQLVLAYIHSILIMWFIFADIFFSSFSFNLYYFSVLSIEYQSTTKSNEKKERKEIKTNLSIQRRDMNKRSPERREQTNQILHISHLTNVCQLIFHMFAVFQLELITRWIAFFYCEYLFYYQLQFFNSFYNRKRYIL